MHVVKYQYIQRLFLTWLIHKVPKKETISLIHMLNINLQCSGKSYAMKVIIQALIKANTKGWIGIYNIKDFLNVHISQEFVFENDYQLYSLKFICKITK